jgi:hypothetical protein
MMCEVRVLTRIFGSQQMKQEAEEIAFGGTS